MPEQGAAPKYSAQPGRGWPPLLRAELFGRSSCQWQAGVHVSKPRVSKPSWHMRWQQETPKQGVLNQRRAWRVQQVKWKHLPSMYVACRAGHPAETRGDVGLRESSLAQRDKGCPESHPPPAPDPGGWKRMGKTRHTKEVA